MSSTHTAQPSRATDGAVSQKVRLFYRDDYVYDVVEAGARHFYDTQKPRRIRDALIATGLVGETDFVAPEPPSTQELLLVHTAAYLEEIQRPERLARLLMLDPSRPWDRRLLEPFLYASGGTLAAARFAVNARGIGINLGGGFHHAQADKGEGFDLCQPALDRASQWHDEGLLAPFDLGRLPNSKNLIPSLLAASTELW